MALSERDDNGGIAMTDPRLGRGDYLEGFDEGYKVGYTDAIEAAVEALESEGQEVVIEEWDEGFNAAIRIGIRRIAALRPEGGGSGGN